MSMYRFFYEHFFFISLGYKTQKCNCWVIRWLSLTFWGTGKLFELTAPIFAYVGNSRFHPNLLFPDFFGHTPLSINQVVSCGLICISLIANDLRHLFMAGCLSVFAEVYFFFLFQNWIICPFYWILHAFYIF